MAVRGDGIGPGPIATTARTPAELHLLVGRSAAGTPLEHILGWVRFRDLRLSVAPGVFVPRSRSEFHVEQALALTEPGAVVLDLCCGTGALGTVVATERRGVELHAADIDAAGVRCARHNLAPLGGQVHRGDLFDPLPESLWGRVDVLVANAPHVPTGEITLPPSEARDHEPRISLDGGSDGLDVVGRRPAPSDRNASASPRATFTGWTRDHHAEPQAGG